MTSTPNVMHASLVRHDDDDDATNPMASPSVRNERQPLLNHVDVSNHASTTSINGETEGDEDDVVITASIARQVFTIKQFAVMICFFMNGLCTTAVGVRYLPQLLP